MSSDKHLRLNTQNVGISLLDEIAEILYLLEQLQAEQKPTGTIDSETYAVTSTTQTINCPLNHPWYSVSIVNDGPNSVDVTINKAKNPSTHEIKLDETLELDLRRPLINNVQFKCASNETATVRMVAIR